jgi:molybdopterin-guanine dinucleotide biosynthesis protein B
MPYIVSIVGKSGAGKTTLLEKLIPVLKHRGHTIGVIKHAGHGFQMDIDGKDSYRHKSAGASSVAVISRNKLAVLKELPCEIALDDVIAYFADVDILITEGFKRENKPKIEVFRKGVHKTPLCIGDNTLIAYISDENLKTDVPVFGLEDIEILADFIENKFHLKQRESSPVMMRETVVR